MSTPRKNFNYMSPYAKPMQQYPSQSGEYISFSVGGGQQFQAEDNGRGGSANLHYPNGSSRQRRQNSNFRKSISYSNDSAQKKWDTPRKTDFQNRNNPHYKEKHQQVTISSYLHSSMTEDPWKEFMERIDAINNSKISLKTDEHMEPGNGSDYTEANDEDLITKI